MVVPDSDFCEKPIRNKAVLVIWLVELQECTVRGRPQLGKLTSKAQGIKWVRPKLGFCSELRAGLVRNDIRTVN
jgi:hypothetical protein